ncbi:major facilitator superfamily domain-containing protein [Aspergillus unguis]
MPPHHRDHHTTDAAEKRVESLVRKYRRPNSPSALLFELYNDPDNYSILVGALRRQTALSKCRSQDFKDSEVTIYEKALLALSNEGGHATDPGALELYLTEFLGVVPIAPLEDGMDIVRKHVELQGLLHKARGREDREPITPAPSKTLKREREESSSPFDIEQYERKYSEPLHYDGDEEEGGEDRPQSSTTTFSRQAQGQGRNPDVRVARLLEVYNRAKEDYFTIKRQDGFEDLNALRFLRDSAENALRYLHANGMSDNVYVSDLEHTFAIARDKTTQILGGRKRHFDEDTGITSVKDTRGKRRRGSSRGSTPKKRSKHRSRRVIDSYRPHDGYQVQTDFGTLHDQDHFSEYEADVFNYDDEARPKFSRPRVPKYTPVEEQQVVKRFDRRLVPFLALLYLLSFLDRSNIGNAKIAGLTEDLHLSSSQYEWLLTAFYITYILFEWMTLLYRVFPAHVYISLCVAGWGLIASFQSLANSFGSMVFLRALLGISEAAFGPGVPFYLSLFYKREELAFRNGLFISAAPLASSFASSLAWVIVKSSSEGPIAPWRALFLVEGFPSVIVAVFAWFMIPDSPGTANFLEPRQRMVAQMRMGDAGRSEYRVPGHRKRFNWSEVRKTLADPTAYITALMFFCCNVAFSSMPVFLPTIIQDMGYSSTSSQALSAPPYLFAFITVLLTSYMSDKTRTRSPYLIAHSLISCLSYLTIAVTGLFHSYLPENFHILIRYLAVYPATAGFFSAITLIITWSMDNRVDKEGKGASVAILNVVGQCGPLLGTRLYPAESGPWYISGMSVCAGFMSLVTVLAILLRVLFQRENMRIGDGFGPGREREREVLMGDDALSGSEEKEFTYIL